MYKERLAFCALSGTDIVDCGFKDHTTQPPVKWTVMGTNPTNYDISGGDKDALVYHLVNRDNDYEIITVSLRELRARACGNARAARRAARRSYVPVAEAEFDSSSSLLRWPNGRVLLKADEATLSEAMTAVQFDCVDASRQFSVFDEDYRITMQEYSSRVIMRRHESEGTDGALRAVKKWPRVQPYWRRVRRRICWRCYRQVDLSEPRFLVCSGCGDARYCSEECQRQDWPVHQHKCTA